MNLVTKKQAAEMLGVTGRTLDNYIIQGLLVPHYPGGIAGKMVKFKRIDIENFFRPVAAVLIDGQ